MAKYRNKPVVIEAVKVRATDYNGKDWDGLPFSELPAWLSEAIGSGAVFPVTPNNTDYAEWQIRSLEGELLASPGDYIVRGVRGELYKCRGDIFEETYEPVEKVERGE